MRKDDTAITGPDTLKGKKVCSATGSTPIQRIKDEHSPRRRTRRVREVLAVRRRSCSTSQVDAVTTDDAILKGYAAQQPDKLKVVGKPFSTEQYGVGLPKDDTALRDRRSTTLLLEADRRTATWQTIYDGTLGKSGSRRRRRRSSATEPVSARARGRATRMRSFFARPDRQLRPVRRGLLDTIKLFLSPASARSSGHRPRRDARLAGAGRCGCSAPAT